MVAPAVEGIDLFNIAGRSISGWVPSFKMSTATPVKQPFCSQLEERLLLWLEYHPLVASYARGDIGPQFAATYRLPTLKHAPFTIGYLFEGKPHEYLPDVVGTLTSGKPFIAEAGMEDDKRSDRNLAKAEAARRLAHIQKAYSGLAQSKPSRRCSTTISSTCMPGKRASLPLTTLPPLCRKSGPPEMSPASKRSRAVSPDGGPPSWSKRRSGNSWEIAPPQGIC
jgi:hypothetical protein